MDATGRVLSVVRAESTTKREGNGRDLDGPMSCKGQGETRRGERVVDATGKVHWREIFHFTSHPASLHGIFFAVRRNYPKCSIQALTTFPYRKKKVIENEVSKPFCSHGFLFFLLPTFPPAGGATERDQPEVGTFTIE